ncbi:hypothetical protein RJ640_028766 [Escallonia rubra]|uniref:Uncharacterized protein n=1 Tax=Escallonia rubra TaxID=112253 RepID=A0AA88UBQ0_9ASTE|nr:hypothetical protein RJ640_028766 [Escallonia rubra]
MDTKALAKSKRAHSQHHSKKHHPNPTSKPPPVGSAGATATKKPAAGKQIKEKPRLPSNWDRYEEEYDLGTEIPVEGSSTASQHSDVVVPKSKGADYGYLISEAKSQMGSSSDVFPAFDDVFTDFNQGLGSLLSVRGKSTLSWTEGGNFVVENKATASNKVPFLSLNLHALAEQLSKVDLVQRLFIEADLLPPEPYTGELQASWKQGSCQDQATCENIDAKKEADELASSCLFDRNRQAIPPFEVTSSDNTITSSLPVPDIGNENSKSMNHDEDELWEVGRAGKMLEPAAELDTGVANHRFEAAAAEAELDMLLDSFNETNFLGISGVTSYVSQGQASTSMLGGISSDQLLTQDPGSSKPALAAALDDTIDDLLNETSSPVNQNGASQFHEVKAAPVNALPSPSPPPISRSKLLDDFDSWLDTI